MRVRSGRKVGPTAEAGAVVVTHAVGREKEPGLGRPHLRVRGSWVPGLGRECGRPTAPAACGHRSLGASSGSESGFLCRTDAEGPTCCRGAVCGAGLAAAGSGFCSHMLWF